MSNRAARRAAARSSNASLSSANDIPLAQPTRAPASKTLVELAAERQDLLDKGRPFKRNDGLESEQPEELIGRLGEAVVWTITLIMLHFTLDVLVHHQYAEEISWDNIVYRCIYITPGMLRIDIVAQSATFSFYFFFIILGAMLTKCQSFSL
jgi:hypothetical protein